jgi:RNAse (barnase) inhibitor barstar
MKPTLEIDGDRFDTLEEFYDEISRVLIPGAFWGRNLDAFDDILCGGFGTPDGGFILVWKNHEGSRKVLGYDETVREIRSWLEDCHPSNIMHVKEQLADAERREGTTVFDLLVEIIRHHGPGGSAAEHEVELLLR